MRRSKDISSGKRCGVTFEEKEETLEEQAQRM